MHWKFEPFFSIDILHGKYPPPAVGQPAPPTPFSVEPTRDTQRQLSSMGWIFKPHRDGGGGTLYAEKIVAPDGTTTLKSKPKQNQSLTFVLRLDDASLLNHTKPYSTVPSVLPPFLGRSRLLYFDNLNSAASAPDTFSLTKKSSVQVEDFASWLPTNFLFRASSPTVTQIEMTPLEPGGIPKPFLLDTSSKSVEIKLAAKGYRLTQQPVNQAETLFLSEEAMPGNILGVACIFQPPGADWEPFRRYQIMFDKA